MVDTGASQAVILRYPFAAEHRLFGRSDAKSISETVASGKRAFVTLSAKELELGRWKFQNPAVKAYGSRNGAGGYTSSDGLFGNDVLRHFRVTFDYSRNECFSKKRPPSAFVGEHDPAVANARELASFSACGARTRPLPRNTGTTTN